MTEKSHFLIFTPVLVPSPRAMIEKSQFMTTGSNPDISQKYKMGDISKGVVNTL
jgi:hypothetical protein